MGSSRDLFLVFLVIVFLSVNTKCGLGARDLTETFPTALSKDNHYAQVKENLSLGNPENNLRVKKSRNTNPKFEADEPANEPACEENSITEKVPKGSYHKPAVTKCSKDPISPVNNNPKCSENSDESSDKEPAAVPQCAENTTNENSNDKPLCSNDPISPVGKNPKEEVPDDKLPEVPDEDSDKELDAVPQCPGNTTNENSNDQPQCSGTTKVPKNRVKHQRPNTVVPETADQPASEDETSIKPIVP